MRSKDKWLKDYPMIDYEKADCKRIRNSVGEKLSEQKGEDVYKRQIYMLIREHSTDQLPFIP